MKRDGFTVTELLIVMGVVGILAALALGTYDRWRARTVVMDGAQQFAQAVTRTRTEAKRKNACWQITLGSTATTNTQYVINQFTTPTCSGTPAAAQTYSVPAGTRLVPLDSSGNPTTLTTPANFTPPYGTTDASANTYGVRWANDTTVQRTVRITSILGKVIVK